ncbi:Protein OS-9 -like protein [Ceratocystis fimbriata CBS 114723]|uniref:Endoplasmic reticulum lectin n=1 Tax=Ceratocystis fimbriata CBS 114723 TaxID=1035309 RepID=A0A2C5XCT3_9PEZI|nr:Protein OS-9 -like protein [Ceratocystis fimbriata CBS 114723]
MLSLKTTLPLAGLLSQALGAVHHAVNHDVYAYPQFEVVFDDAYILPHDAEALLAKQADSVAAAVAGSPPIASEAGESSDIVPSGANKNTEEADAQDTEPNETYELMDIYPGKYLCSIPIIQPKPAENATATALALENEKKELARALEDGWKILKSMDGECLFFMSGWWSYKYCYDSYIVQFHALASGPGQAPPVPDPKMAAYVLGRSSKSHNEDGNWLDEEWQKGADDVKSSTTDMQVKGDQRFLVHRLTGGTMCDLTHRERTIEIQYHCAPGASHDSIAWIKEVTTCAYLMVINTPRLCKDAAFLPQKEAAANVINCREIAPKDLSPAEADAWFAQRKHEEANVEDHTMAGGINVKTFAPHDDGQNFVEERRMELMIEFDQEEIKNLSPEEIIAMAQKRAEEILASSRKNEHTNDQDKHSDTTWSIIHDGTAGDAPPNDTSLRDIMQALSDIISHEMVVMSAKRLRREVEETLATYKEFETKLPERKTPEWLKEHILILEEALRQDDQFGIFEQYQKTREGRGGAQEPNTPNGDNEGSQEEFFVRKDEL